MERPSQSPRDKVLWELASHGGMMERSVLRRRMGMKYAELDLILEDLEKEGRIRRSTSPTGETLIALKSR
jgi:DNA-binding MarR family transcriptional regulator